MSAIQSAIVKGDLAPGSKLREPDLARRYGTSRGPLREAIRRLEARRLVEVAAHTGARVARLSLGQLLELYEAREALEGLACRLAAERVTAREADDLKRLLENHERDVVASEGREYFQSEGDLDLHFRLAQASGNAIVTRILCDDLYHLMRMYRYKFSLRRDRPVAALKEHWRIIDAVADRDGELAELLMRRHIRSTRNAIERHFSNPDSGEART